MPQLDMRYPALGGQGVDSRDRHAQQLGHLFGGHEIPSIAVVPRIPKPLLAQLHQAEATGHMGNADGQLVWGWEASAHRAPEVEAHGAALSQNLGIDVVQRHLLTLPKRASAQGALHHDVVSSKSHGGFRGVRHHFRGGGVAGQYRLAAG